MTSEELLWKCYYHMTGRKIDGTPFNSGHMLVHYEEHSREAKTLTAELVSWARKKEVPSGASKPEQV